MGAAVVGLTNNVPARLSSASEYPPVRLVFLRVYVFFGLPHRIVDRVVRAIVFEGMFVVIY